MERESLWRQAIEARLRKLESASPGGFSADAETTYLRGGRNLEVVDGDIIIDGGQLVAGPTTVDASGVMVGTDVQLNSSGLFVAGGLVQAVWADVASVLTQNTSINTSLSEVNSVEIDPPSWVQAVSVVSTVVAQVSNDSGGDYHVRTRTTIDDDGAQEDVGGQRQQFIPNTRVATVNDTHTHSFALSPAGRTFDVTQDAMVTAGSSGTNAFRLNVLVLGFRTAFT